MAVTAVTAVTTAAGRVSRAQLTELCYYMYMYVPAKRQAAAADCSLCDAAQLSRRLARMRTNELPLAAGVSVPYQYYRVSMLLRHTDESATTTRQARHTKIMNE